MKKSVLFLATMVLIVTSCEQDQIGPKPKINFNSELVQKVKTIAQLDPVSQNSIAARQDGVEALMASINESIADQNLMLEKIEFIGAEQAGNTVFFEDRGNKQLSSDYVPNDPRNGTGTDVPFIIDGTELGTSSGMSEFQTYAAMVNAMNTWDAVTCSGGLNIPDQGVAPFDVGFVQFLLGFGGINGFFPGTIVHAGILPGAFFDAFEPGGGSFILGVTFTFVWIGDLDEDGRGDVAIKEVYMNDSFNWQNAPDDVLGNGIYDFETVVLHEVGHGLSQAHFGKVFATKNGKLHFAPAALMNAGYSVARREVTQTDNAGHCSNWGNWPNN